MKDPRISILQNHSEEFKHKNKEAFSGNQVGIIFGLVRIEGKLQCVRRGCMFSQLPKTLIQLIEANPGIELDHYDFSNRKNDLDLI
jgi:hypothetical protein